MYYGFNAEYLFYPFCESRSVGEMLAFHAEERRDAMLSYVIDLYAPDLGRHPDAVARAEAHLDNTYACPWHNNLTAAVASFRTAKALRRNPGSRFDLASFAWYNSVPFE